MRPLKPLFVALSSVLATVFGALFFGTPAHLAPTTSVKDVQPDLQARRATAAAPELNAARESRQADQDRTSGSAPYFPAQDFSPRELLRLTRAIAACPGFGAAERWADQRRALLVGTVELRI